MAALIIRGGAVIAARANLQAWGRHAELRALGAVRDARGCTLVIVRAEFRMSKPCAVCQQAIKARGISRVVYCDWQGSMVVERT